MSVQFCLSGVEREKTVEEEKFPEAKRRCEERMPNLYVIEDRNRQRHRQKISFRVRKCRRGTSSRFRRRCSETGPKNHDQILDRNHGRSGEVSSVNPHEKHPTRGKKK
ncbi:hypothetical protein Y032_0409g938 [Ancylostoma ceylanicum]|uniref:Uncharacterized protein n=1 Tax=Ancylostoma ceylanicum TaxID=53326 RepID=A0A016X1Z8_9BILA|nr:hypothetical protein Y032_0409g938 [Ancylostoma ceylanicum]